ncbi:hypothetical protein COCON_G00177990 [Conger conger]|uniref:Uncharacterized protein n=1 Tax=Conger conger TaxID=82655 RepID=A0A9Q1D5R4_CONCO|nr:uncharacterized protein C6orf132 homolog [Conger conger]KAJ8258787.1 hypothetical protein COCON_G00177990 [Conger conger]
MKKSHFSNLLGRKNQSLFDTNIEIKERDNVELVIDAAHIPESGTAKVRARPTVKHFSSSTSSSDIMQGFAVPTPKVPVFSSFKGPNTNGTGGKLSNGVSVPDSVEGDIFIPPPPSMAPPPPPSQFFIPPPPDFSFDSSPQDEDLASLHPPPMPPPKPPSKSPSPHHSWDPNFAALKPPPMAPPKAPSDLSSSNVSAPISAPLTNGPECPKFAPPKPPGSVEKLQTTPPKSHKVPPLKPVRLSSMSSLDNLPLFPAPTPPASASTPSTFNPQNTAKLYSVPKPGVLSREPDIEKPTRPILFLQDNSTDPIPIQFNEKMPSDNTEFGLAKAQVPPTKPARRNSSGLQLEKDLQDLKENLQSTLPDKAVKVQEDTPVTPLPLLTPQVPNKPTPELTPTASPIPEKTPPATPYSNSPGRSRKLLPYVSRTPYYRRVPDSSTPGAASPLALLQAAKEREKQRGSLSRENSGKRNSYGEPSTVSIHQSQSTPNSFTVIPRPTSSLSHGGRESPDPLHRFSMENDSRSASPSSLVAELLEKHDTEEAPPTAPDTTFVQEVKVGQAKEVKHEEPKEDVSVPFIPPPPEFANSDTEEESSLEQPEPPPSFPPPDPPSQKVPSPIPILAVPPPPSMVPPPPPKPKASKPPGPPKLPVQKAEVKPKPPSQADKLKPQPPLPPAQALSPSQATLLSILQKKMLEMDQKHSFQEVNTNNDDWGSADEPTIPVRPPPIPKPKSTSSLPRQSAGLDMGELERTVAKKAQDSIAPKAPTSNGSQSKQAYGMTFTVRPGTKEPITPVIKGDTP